MKNYKYARTISSMLGDISISVSESGVCGVLFVETQKNKYDLPIDTATQNELLDETIRQLNAYFAGKLNVFDLPLDLIGTPFQQKVWLALTQIPFGQTCSYKTLSEKLGDVKAIRAVGTANGKNPVSIIVPCHRVIGSDGTLVGYAGELWRKEKLLTLEGSFTPTQQMSLF